MFFSKEVFLRSKYKFKSGKIFLFLIVLILFIIFISLLFVNNKFKSKIQNPGINVDVINEKGKEEIISKTEDKKDTKLHCYLYSRHNIDGLSNF